MPAPSLSAMAQNAAVKNISSITDVADLPYHAVEPILRRIDNPAQLREIEVACPHIAENSGPLWQELIKRDVSNAERKMLYPKDPKHPMNRSTPDKHANIPRYLLLQNKPQSGDWIPGKRPGMKASYWGPAINCNQYGQMTTLWEIWPTFCACSSGPILGL